MATPEEELRRRLAGLVQSTPVVRASRSASQAFREAGGGARGLGAGERAFIEQAVIRPPIEASVAVARPIGEFLQGLVGGAPAPPARRAGTQATRLPSLVDVTAATPPTPAQPTARPPLRPGQTARPSVTQTQQPSAAPTYSLDSVPQGGGFISFDEPLSSDRVERLPSYLRDQLQQTGEVRITPEQGRSLASQTTVVPSSFFTGGGGQTAAVQPVEQTRGPQRSRLISDRSQDFDTLLRDLVSQATREPGSYGELFRRRGVLDALSQVAGVAQGAGTNLTQDITNLRDVLERRRSADLTAEAQAAQRGVTTRGQDLAFESGLLQNLVGARNVDVQAGVQREGQQAQLTGTREQIASLERRAREAPIYALQQDAEEQLRRQILVGLNSDGTPMSPEQREQALALLARMSSASPLSQLLVP